MNKTYWIYILANGKNGALYIGITSDLRRRIMEHKEKVIDGFTKTYGIDKLVYFEETTNVEDAIAREKQLKKWKREWKIDLIEKNNSEWKDLAV